MKMGTGLLLIGLLIAATASGQTIPPVNLQAELLPAGEVSLTWLAPPANSMIEDFEDGVADGFVLYPDQTGFQFEDGYMKIVPGPGRKSAVWTQQLFTEFTLEAEFLSVSNDFSRGVLFRADGPDDDNYNGYAMYITAWGTYSIWKYINGAQDGVLPWTDSPDINQGMDVVNTIKIVGSGNSFDIFINGVYQQTYTDNQNSHPQGMVGCYTTSGVAVWYDEFSCLPVAFPVDAPAASAVMPPTSAGTRELDEFIEYRIYRDGTLVGVSGTEAFTDQLPNLGDFTYTVTALYDEGESNPDGPVSVSWATFDFQISSQMATIPAEGGTLLYDVSLTSYLNVGFNNVNFWTEAVAPNGQTYGPLFVATFYVAPLMDIDVFFLTQQVPGVAPAGVYTFYGNIGFMPNAFLIDSFTFEKLGSIVDGVPGKLNSIQKTNLLR